MARIHRQALIVGHGGEVLHRKPVLRPVLKDGPVAAVRDQFVWELSNGGIQVVHDHQHDGSGLCAVAWVCIDGVGPHRHVRGPIPMHDDAPITVQFLEEFSSHGVVMVAWKVPEGVLQGEPSFTWRQRDGPVRGVVHGWIEVHRRGHVRRDAFKDGGSEAIAP